MWCVCCQHLLGGLCVMFRDVSRTSAVAFMVDRGCPLSRHFRGSTDAPQPRPPASEPQHRDAASPHSQGVDQSTPWRGGDLVPSFLATTLASSWVAETRSGKSSRPLESSNDGSYDHAACSGTTRSVEYLRIRCRHRPRRQH